VYLTCERSGNDVLGGKERGYLLQREKLLNLSIISEEEGRFKKERVGEERLPSWKAPLLRIR